MSITKKIYNKITNNNNESYIINYNQKVGRTVYIKDRQIKVEDIKNDLKNGLSYKDIVGKYNIPIDAVKEADEYDNIDSFSINMIYGGCTSYFEYINIYINDLGINCKHCGKKYDDYYIHKNSRNLNIEEIDGFNCTTDKITYIHK